VRVLEQRSVVGEDGLIGADVFSSFLVDIDFPNEKLRLSELPKRPDDTSANLSLKTEDEDPEDLEQLRESRRQILKVADVIVPGHGPAFRPTESTPR
jgi:glyoxylase-like metal-dependent hydrolase (beta-lactamase superfamily II)